MPNAAATFRPCMARGMSPVAARNVVGKFLDPESGVRIKMVDSPDPFPRGTEASDQLALLRRRGVRAFFAAGGTHRMVGRFLRAGACVRVEVEAAA